MPIVLHGNPAQSEACLLGLVSFARRIAQERGDVYAQLGDFRAVVDYIRSRPFEPDDGTASQGVRQCFPVQRARIWPATFNCFEATAHALGAFMFWGLVEHLDFHVFDKNLSERTRHVWPVVVDPETGRGWIIILDSRVPRRHRRMLANDWYNDLLGGLHTVGRVALSAFGMSKTADTMEGVWGDNLPDWARDKPREGKKESRPAEKGK
jgi:hypothetical protein